jgi:hypothetical protein
MNKLDLPTRRNNKRPQVFDGNFHKQKRGHIWAGETQTDERC